MSAGTGEPALILAADPADAQPRSRNRRSRLLWIAGGCAVLLHLAAALFLLHPPALLGRLAPAPAPAPQQEAEMEWVQNDRAAAGDAAVGGHQPSPSSAQPKAEPQKAAPPSQPLPPAPDLPQVKDGETAPPAPPQQSPVPPAPQQTDADEQTEHISLGGDEDAGEIGEQSGGTATTPAQPNPKANRLPRYPLAAARAGQHGEVDMFVHVLSDGTAGQIVIANSSGSTVLDQTAEKTVMAWKFKPATAHGKPIPSDIPVRLNFVLH